MFVISHYNSMIPRKMRSLEHILYSNVTSMYCLYIILIDN